MKKELKDQIIESISAQLNEYSNFYVTDIAGLNAKDTGKLRRACFDEGIKLSVVKNTLFAHVLKGNTAIMYCNVPNAPGKLIKKLNKEGMEKPVVMGAYVQECAFIGADKLDQLAAIKTREELIGDIIGLLQSPIRRVVSALQTVAEDQAEDAVIKALAAVKAAPADAPAAE